MRLNHAKFSACRIYGDDLLEYLQIDDPVSAFPVHGLCGAWGVLAVGFFARRQNIVSGWWRGASNTKKCYVIVQPGCHVHALPSPAPASSITAQPMRVADLGGMEVRLHSAWLVSLHVKLA